MKGENEERLMNQFSVGQDQYIRSPKINDSS